jgi:hypothetical protein
LSHGHVLVAQFSITIPGHLIHERKTANPCPALLQLQDSALKKNTQSKNLPIADYCKSFISMLKSDGKAANEIDFMGLA